MGIKDVHSPAKIRINAVLSTIDEFYKIYGITKIDFMYVEEHERVGVW